MSKRRATKEKQPGPLNPLIEAINTLAPTGASGFEGLLRDLLASITGQPFRIMKSSHQGGVDALSDRPSNFLTVGLEGKQYAETTRLPLDALKAKIVDAVDTHPGLDLWILTTTREISATDQQALAKLGEKSGVAVEIVDWPQSPNTLPPLAVLAATAADVTQRFLPADPKLEHYLAEIARHPDFESERARLQTRFTAADVGYAAARRSMAEWLRDSMRNMGRAKAQLGGHANLLESTVHRIQRSAIDSNLKAWYEAGAVAPAALLGSEGVGKTWAALAWWHSNAAHDGTPLPLTLIVPARYMEVYEAEALIAHLLFKRTGLRSHDFWAKRVQRWLSAAAPNLKFLLLFDGLNERWQFKQWTALLQPLFADPRKGYFAVALTCRPDHWQNALNGLVDLKPHALEITVERFSAQELDALLRAYGRTREDFSAPVLKLMAIPRLSQRAIELRNELKDTHDITPERLFYEDWKTRMQRRGGEIISDPEFKELIRSFGHEIREAASQGNTFDALPPITRGNLIKEIGRHSGHEKSDLVDTLSEIIDGGWLKPIDDKPHHFAVEAELIPFVLAMALIDDLKRAKHGELEEQLGVFLDDLRGLDLASDILRAATTVALLDTQSSKTLKREVAGAWLNSQQFRREDFDAFWRLATAAPNLFMGLAEELWTGKNAHRGHFDEMLIRGIARAAEVPAVRATLLEQATQWLGTYWLDPYIGFFLSYDPDEPRVAVRRKETATRVTEWQSVVVPNWPTASVPVREAADPQGTSWFIHRAVGVLSFLPRAPMIRALLAWSISRALMKWSNHFDEVAWLLRLNSIDPAETHQAVMQAIGDLQAIGHPIALQAAKNLIYALATPRAMARLPGDALAYVEPDEPPQHIRFLAEQAPNPSVEPGERERALIVKAGEFREYEKLWTSRQQTMSDLDFESVEQVLARWNPSRLGEMLRAIPAEAPTRAPEALWRLSLESPTRLIVMDSQQRQALADVPIPDAVQGDLRAGTIGYQVVACLFDQSAEEQIRVLAALDGSTSVPSDHDLLLSPPLKTDFDFIKQQLRQDAAPEALRRWLIYLSRTSVENLPADLDVLLSLSTHADQLIRHLSLQAIADSQEPSLVQAFFAGPWRYQEGMRLEEAFNGSMIVCRASQHVEDPQQLRQIIDRISPESLAVLLPLHPANDVVLDAYAAYVERSVESCAVKQERPLRDLIVHHDDSLAVLVRHRGAEVARGIDTRLQSGDKRWLDLGIEEFPVASICRALLKQGFTTGVTLWRALWMRLRHGGVNQSALSTLAFDCPDSAAIRELRMIVIEHASCDDELQHIAMVADACKQTDSLISLIEDDLNRPSAAAIARAMCLAGWLDSSSEIERLWSGVLKSPPAPGWLAKVHAWAYENMQRNCWAHEWFDRLMQEQDRDRAYGFYVLFAACVDRRVLAWAQRRLSVSPSLSRALAHHMALSLSALATKLKTSERKFQDTLFGEKIIKNYMFPWL